jgi:hypothetical protein
LPLVRVRENTFELHAEVTDRLPPLLGILLQAALKSLAKARRKCGWKFSELGFPRQYRCQDVGNHLATECLTSRQHLEQHAAECPDVSSMIHGLPPRLLGSHVARGAEDDALRRRRHAQRRRVSDIATLGLQGFRETEVEHLDLAFRRDLDIGRLQIAMNDALLVCRFNRFGNLQRKPDGLPHDKRPTLDHVGQRVAFDQFENEEPGP